MRPAGINRSFLDPVVAGTEIDVFYHLGLRSSDPVLDELRDISAVVVGGSGARLAGLAAAWSSLHGGANVLALPKADRFVTHYCAGVLFVSHGMGMASASIAMQELMRLVYVLKRGDLDALDAVFWARIGTSGGIGLAPGTVVVSTEGVMADLRPYRVLHDGESVFFPGVFPARVVDEIVAANADAAFPIVTGRTVAGNEFFLEQARLDGAIVLDTAESKQRWLESLESAGVVNIEMEGAMFAGYLGHWGFPEFAMVCCTLLDRLEGDQVVSTADELAAFEARAAAVLFNYLQETGR